MGTHSGNEVLRELEQGLDVLRRDLRESDATVQSTSARIENLSRQKLDAYRQLAELRLARFERGNVIRDLDTVSQDIARLVDARKVAHGQLHEDLAARQDRLTLQEQERERQREALAAVVGALDEREAAVQATLEQDPAFGDQDARAHRAEDVADEAEAKLEDARADQQEKGAPYESDELFMYLWNRQYGTSGYRANPLARLLDRWVARLCGYAEARPNYWMLKEIPLRLEEHAKRARAVADNEFAALAHLETEAADRAGVPELRDTVAAAEQGLAKLDAEIAASEQGLANLRAELGRYAAGDDEPMRRILERLAAEMRSDGISALRAHAAATPEQVDDELVARIIGLDEQLEGLADELEDRRKLYLRRAQRSQALEKVRRQFKRKGFDDLRSEFADSGLITAALGEFLRGVLDDDDLWRQIARQHRYRTIQTRPNFGSAGFPGRNGTWNFPQSRPPVWGNPRPGGFRLPKGGFGGSRRGGGGGFSTGGGF